MSTITIQAKADLHNGGQCFTKDKTYQVNTHYHTINSTYDLMERTTTNDLGQPHKIGSWHKKFRIIKG